MNWWTFWDTHDINDHDVPFLISFNCLCKNTLLSRWKVRYVHTGPTGGKKLPCKYLPFWQKEKKNLNIKVKALLYWDLLGPRWQHGARSGCEQTRDQTYSAPGRKLSPLPHEHPTPASIPISELMCGQPRSAAPLWEWRPHRDLLCFSGWPTPVTLCGIDSLQHAVTRCFSFPVSLPTLPDLGHIFFGPQFAIC